MPDQRVRRASGFVQPGLVGRVAYITGGTRGIGREVACRLAESGARVVISGRDAEVGRRSAAELADFGEVTFVQADVSLREEIDALVDQTVERYGRLDIAILNAGGVDHSSPVVDMSDEEWQFELDLNLNHTFRGIRRSLRYMIPQRSGRILAMSSVEGKHGKPRIAGYVANKHAINGLVKAVAKEVGPDGITVNAVCPGLVDTDMLRRQAGAGLGLNGAEEVMALYGREAALGRVVTLAEVGAVTAFLASDLAGGITGALISVDGGTAAY